MEHYSVEGLYLTKKGVIKLRKTGKYAQSDLELFTKLIWANNLEEAIRLATEELGGGEWREKPKVSKTTEEERMRLMGAPEFPGLSSPTKKRKK